MDLFFFLGRNHLVVLSVLCGDVESVYGGCVVYVFTRRKETGKFYVVVMRRFSTNEGDDYGFAEKKCSKEEKSTNI